MKKAILIISILFFTVCILGVLASESKDRIVPKNAIVASAVKDTVRVYDSLFTANKIYISNGFDYPVGKPDAIGYYNAQPFTKNTHLGDDWNGIKGGNSDKGDPVYSISNGYVNFAENVGGGWGKIVRIIHCLPGKPTRYVESFYAHLDTMEVREKMWVKRGDKIGTIGDADGIYVAHLHFEIRHTINMPVGPGYSTDTTGYINPTVFIKKNRKF